MTMTRDAVSEVHSGDRGAENPLVFAGSGGACAAAWGRAS